jgi:hypothetical protein
MIGHADGSLAVGAAVVLGCVAVMWLICHRILTKGYRLKS